MKKKKKKKIFGDLDRPRISIYRSNKEIYAQVIDDSSGKTLVSSSSREKEFWKKKNNKNKIELSYEVGKSLGNKIKKLKIKKLVFDKGKYLYHGRIRSLAEGIRNVGLEF
ncbi:50S ribosomal protein L18 [Blattabacterium cuenoti]|uniref:50S ribosomal protein L18 n=1 Tax=Blattabacterium cuenoti TaxID=1653831 RepID=UPI00163CBC8E|nr:50S ribosomal protein L18 [Blattabacterium cuenoti]